MSKSIFKVSVFIGAAAVIALLGIGFGLFFNWFIAADNQIINREASTMTGYIRTLCAAAMIIVPVFMLGTIKVALKLIRMFKFIDSKIKHLEMLLKTEAKETDAIISEYDKMIEFVTKK